MGKAAARVLDMHVCPLATPGVPPVPHVGGPITGPGVLNVLIGGQPAAVMGDVCTCIGPPDAILIGSTGVLIGGKPAARMGDSCVHGGTISAGLPTVLIGETGGGGSAPVPPQVEAAIKAIQRTMPAAAQQVTDQIMALKKAAVKGAPFCAICAAQKNK